MRDILSKRTLVLSMPELLSLKPFIDGHVHLREPGSNKAETIESGTRAASEGGVGAVADMSNNAPLPTIDEERVLEKHSIIEEEANINVGTAVGMQPEYDNVPQLCRALPLSIFVKAYGGPTTNIDRETDYEAYEFDEHLDGIKQVDPDKLVVFHSGNDNYRDFIGHAAQDRGLRVRLAHVNKMDQVQAVLEARAKGLEVSSAICPHTMLLTLRERLTRSAFADMKPDLVGEAEADELFDAFVRGDIQELETDHAPHSIESKMNAVMQNPTCAGEHQGRCCGVPSLEHAASVMFWQVRIGRLPLERLVEAYSTIPAYNMRLKSHRGSYVRWDMSDPYRIDESRDVVSQSGWSPYVGMMAVGRVVDMRLGNTSIIENYEHVGRARRVVMGRGEAI